MISNINSRSTIADVNSTTSSILNELTNYDFTTDLYLTGLIEVISTTNLDLTQAIKEKAVISVLGPKDEKRDFALRGVFSLVRAYLYSPDEEIRAAAGVINNVLDKYGLETTELGYSSESSSINAMLSDFEKPEIAAAIAKITTLQPLITALKNSQVDFEDAVVEQTEAQVQFEKKLSATKLREEVRTMINNELKVYFNAMKQARPELYMAAADVIEAIIENNNSTVRNRCKSTDEQEQKE